MKTVSADSSTRKAHRMKRWLCFCLERELQLATGVSGRRRERKNPKQTRC